MNDVVNIPNLKIVKPLSQLAKNIAKAIVARGFESVSEFEKACGFKHQNIYRLLTGYSQSLHSDALKIVAEKLDIPANVLLNGDERSIELLQVFRQIHKPGWYKIQSDEMKPTLQLGDLAMIDFSVKKFETAGIYALGMAEDFILRRLSMNPLRRTVIVSTDNKNYDYTEEVDAATLQIVGRVVGKYSPFTDLFI